MSLLLVANLALELLAMPWRKRMGEAGRGLLVCVRLKKEHHPIETRDSVLINQIVRMYTP